MLVVDDVGVNRGVLLDLLGPLGFELRAAATGPAALRLAEEFAPELVLLDLRMPGMDGFEVARRLRGLPQGRALKLIAMSASVLSSHRDGSVTAGCDDFLPKPFREDDLLARVQAALKLDWITAREDSPAANAPSAATVRAEPSRLDAVVVAELLAIAQRGEIALLRRRLDEWNGDPLVDVLEPFAKSYRMERIRELLESRLAELRARS